MPNPIGLIWYCLYCNYDEHRVEDLYSFIDKSL